MFKRIQFLCLIWLIISSAYPNLSFGSETIAYIPFLLTLILSNELYIKLEYIVIFCIVYILGSLHDVRAVHVVSGYIIPLIVFDFLIKKQQISKSFINAQFYKFIAITLYLVNCFVVILEYNLQINFFSWDMSYFNRFRATGLWIHPLFNALIHGMTILYILCSTLPKYFKFFLYILGIYVIFMFDARASTLMVLFITIFVFYNQNKISKKALFNMCLFILVLFPLYDYISTSDLGGKLFNAEANKIDIKTEPRLVAFYILFNSSFKDLFLGIGANGVEQLCIKYGVSAIENSLITYLLTYGIIPTMIFFICFIKRLYNIFSTISKKIRIALILGFLISGVTSTALTEVFVWYYAAIIFTSFQPYIYNRLNHKDGIISVKYPR